MPLIAIISDIHGNLEALEAVFKAIEERLDDDAPTSSMAKPSVVEDSSGVA
jgi:hypothetical protein